MRRTTLSFELDKAPTCSRTAPITVKRWPNPRVDALLARFGM